MAHRPRKDVEPARTRLWRWRSNPLRRRSDRVEAWIVLVTWVVAVLGGVITGVFTAGAVSQSFVLRRAEAHAVSAVLTEDAPRTPPVTADGTGGDTVWAAARWTGVDGRAHTGRSEVEPAAEAGTRVTVWTGRTGELVARPPAPAESTLQAAAAGALAALGAGGTAWAGGRLARSRLDRRRLADWEAEWQRVGPQWRKRMTG